MDNTPPGRSALPIYAVAVLVIAPEGIPLVRDPKKPLPVFWKAPGGRSRPGETAEAAAVREIKEEIGITIIESDLSILYEENRESHVFVLFRAALPSLFGLKSRGDEGEEIKVFSPEQIATLPDLLPSHRAIFKKALKNL